jgi:hypothetical protein
MRCSKQPPIRSPRRHGQGGLTEWSSRAPQRSSD